MDSSSKKGLVACLVLSGALLVGSIPVTGALTQTSLSDRDSAQEKPQVLTELESVSVQEIIASEALDRTDDPENDSNQVMGDTQNIDAILERDGTQEIANTPEANTSQEVIVASEDLDILVEERLALHAAQSAKEVSRGGVSKAEEIISNARSLIGIPYVYGGTTTKGFDCSGFTQYVFRASGVELPRSSYSQHRVGTAVAKENLQLGDLVFFSTYDSGASHVGIYIGGGNFIHAANSGITITSLGDSYYARRYLGARRVL
jgi:cell wall-associated NlpC family hydrolase